MSRIVTAAIAGLAALLAVLLGIVAYQQFTAAGTVPIAQFGGPFKLVDGSGATVTDGTYKGRWMLVYFGYTHCPDACPTALNDVAVALDRLGTTAKKVVPVFITVDPERDTPPVMKDYVAAFGPSFVGLTGSADELRRVEHEYRVYVAKHPTPDGGYDMDHSSYIYVMGPDGQFVRTFTHQDDPDEMARELGKLIG